MQLILIANKDQQQELGIEIPGKFNVSVYEELSQVSSGSAPFCVIDLLFENTKERVGQLNMLSASTVIVNSVSDTLFEIDNSFVRIGGWNTLLKRSSIEATSLYDEQKVTVEGSFSVLNKKVQWLPDIAGFISCRVIAQIINEAYYALGEGVSNKEQIDIAMKLGTNYPYGPFEWSEKIGLKNIVFLLEKLSKTEKRYTPCEKIIEAVKS